MNCKKKLKKLRKNRADYEDFIHEIETDPNPDDADRIDLEECGRIVTIMSKLIESYEDLLCSHQKSISLKAEVIRIDRLLEEHK